MPNTEESSLRKSVKLLESPELHIWGNRPNESRLVHKAVEATDSSLLDVTLPIGSAALVAQLKAEGRTWRLVVVFEGVGRRRLLKEMGELYSSFSDGVLAAFPRDACQHLSGRDVVHPRVISSALNFFRMGLLVDGLLIRGGKDPAPWIVDKDDPHRNPIMSMMASGRIPADAEDPTAEFARLTAPTPYQEQSRERFLKACWKACPPTNRRRLW